MSAAAPCFDDVRSAAQRLQGIAHRTPVLTSTYLNQEVGAEIFFKCENLQRMGAFKFRGAYNALAQLDDAQKQAGVVTFSSGNHGQAVAMSARLLGMPATVVMPSDAPTMKIAATRGYGADVVLYDRYKDDREAITADIAQRSGALFLHPYDHADVIAGQGTAALELFDEVGSLDALLTPLGGGGLLAGSALAAHGVAPACQVFGVEPLAGNDGQQSLREGRIVTIAAPKTIADGAQTKSVGRLNFPILQKHVSEVLTATDAHLVDAMRVFASRMKLMVEPTGCLALAAVRAHRERFAGRRIGIVISGGNVDIEQMCALLAGPAAA